MRAILSFCGQLRWLAERDRCKKWLGSQSESVVSLPESDLTNIGEIENLIAVVPSLNYHPTLSDVMQKLQLIHVCFERAVNRDLTQFIALGKIMEQLKITFTQHYNKPLNLTKLLIPGCNSAKIPVYLLFKANLKVLSELLVKNLNIDYQF